MSDDRGLERHDHFRAILPEAEEIQRHEHKL